MKGIKQILGIVACLSLLLSPFFIVGAVGPEGYSPDKIPEAGADGFTPPSLTTPPSMEEPELPSEPELTDPLGSSFDDDISGLIADQLWDDIERFVNWLRRQLLLMMKSYFDSIGVEFDIKAYWNATTILYS